MEEILRLFFPLAIIFLLVPITMVFMSPQTMVALGRPLIMVYPNCQPFYLLHPKEQIFMLDLTITAYMFHLIMVQRGKRRLSIMLTHYNLLEVASTLQRQMEYRLPLTKETRPSRLALACHWNLQDVMHL